MKRISSSDFANFPKTGALSIEDSTVNAAIENSAFSFCSNTVSGGAIRVVASNGECTFKGNCGYECFTLSSNNANDFGQFTYAYFLAGTIVSDYIAASCCPSAKHTDCHNGPLAADGAASFRFSGSNSSNSFCRLGSGFASYRTSDLKLTYMNFGNATTYVDSTTNHWIASLFHSCIGEVDQSNYIGCCSLTQGTTRPAGTFTRCVFTQCQGYAVSSLTNDNIEGDPLPLIVPYTCFISNSQSCKLVLPENCLQAILLLIFIS